MSEPIFKSILGESWEQLPAVMKKHYSNQPFSADVTKVRGTLDVSCRPPLNWMAPLLRCLKQIPVFNEKGVPVDVHFRSDKESAAFHFERIFHFRQSKPYTFRSRMLQIQGSEVVEIMRFGLAWRLNYSWDGERMVLAHRGYAIQFLGRLIPLPLTLLIGKGYAEERVIDDTRFAMFTEITHPWWGKVYEYKGEFEVIG